MSIPLTGTGGLFTRVGKIGATLNTINTSRGTTVPAAVDGIESQYQSADQSLVDSLYSSMSSYQGTAATFLRQLQTLAQSTATQMANDSAPQSSSSSYVVALNSIIAQMKATSQTVKACTVSASSSAGGSNTGNGVFALSVTDNKGYALENAFLESATATVTSDSQTGGTAVARQEPLQVVGEYVVSDTLSWLYPVGSGAVTSVNAVDPTGQQGSTGTRNWTTNGNFESFTSPNTPDSWTVDVGTVGTTLQQSTSVYYDGVSSLRVIGDGSQLTSIYQALSVAPQTKYLFNIFTYLSATPAAGVLEIALTDGSGNVLVNTAGFAQKTTVNLTGQTALSWVAVNGSFETPLSLPATVRLRLRLSTALSNGVSLYVDRFGFTVPTQFYQGGPYLAAFSGSTNFVRNDYFILNISNNYGGQFQRLFEKFFSMRANGLVLPSATGGGETISDSLIS